MVTSGESVWLVHTLPVISRLLIEEIYPCRVSRPAVSNEHLASAILCEECSIGLCVHWAVLFNLYLWICYYNQCPITCFDLLVHIFNCFHAKLLRVIDEILEICCPRNIHPEDINRKLLSRELCVPLCQHLCIDFIVPLAEMEAKAVNGWQRCESRYFGQFLHNSLW